MVQVTLFQKYRAYSTVIVRTSLGFREIHRGREQLNGFVPSLLPPCFGTWGEQISIGALLGSRYALAA